MKIFMHQTHHQLGDIDGQLQFITEILNSGNEGLHILPELFLGGYPLQDLVFQKSFVGKIQNALEKLQQLALSCKNKKIYILVGTPMYTHQDGVIQKIENTLHLLTSGVGIKYVTSKMLLPNYDIFEEKKYFTPGTHPVILEIEGKNIALTICEDMWPSVQHGVDPIKELKKSGKKIDLLVNSSASPFYVGKIETRLSRAKEICHYLGAPFVYVNRVGGEDEILFDGQSFYMGFEQGKIQTYQVLEIFQKSSYSFDLTNTHDTNFVSKDYGLANSWENLFAPRLEKQGDFTRLKNYSDLELQELHQSLLFGLKEFASKCGFKKALVANSGGIDSALVLTLTAQAFGAQNVEAVFMPGLYTSTLSYDLHTEICKNLGIKSYIAPIKFLHKTLANVMKDSFHQDLTGVAEENCQARLRGLMLMSRANQTGAMVINTSNKSEISVGYSTLYGDSIGALSLIGDLYKQEVYTLSHYLNKNYNSPIPQGILSRAPTAELRENQKDQDSLPEYEILDTILEAFHSYRFDQEEIIALGLPAQDVSKTLKLFHTSEFKRKQFPPIIKVKAKSFGFGHRLPITKSSNVFT